MSQLGKPLGKRRGKVGVELGRSTALSRPEGMALRGKVVADVVGDAQVRTDLDLEGKLRRVPLPNGGMEHHAKGLARSVRSC